MARPKKAEGEVLVDLPTKVPPDALEEIEQIANTHDRSRAWVARKLLLRGLADHRRDGLFDDSDTSHLPVFKSVPLAAPKKKHKTGSG